MGVGATWSTSRKRGNILEKPIKDIFLFESCPGLLLLSLTVSVALVEYLCRTPDFDSLDTALSDGILRFERLVGRQMPKHFRSLAGQEAHLRQLRAT